MPKKTFDIIFLEAVDDALSSLGESAKQSIYFHLEMNFNLTRSQIPYRFQDFADGLEKIFGVGARFLEILIMKNLHEKANLNLAWAGDKDLVFLEYVTMAKQKYMRTARAKPLRM